MTYETSVNLAKRLIETKGRMVSIVYRSQGIYNPTNDDIAGASSETVDVYGVFLDYDERNIDGTLIRQGDKKMLLAAKNIQRPIINDIINDGEIEYSIVNIKELAPGDETIIYQLQLRK